MTVREHKSLEDAVNMILVDPRYSPATVANYALTLRPMVSSLGSIRPLEDITYSDLLLYTNKAFARSKPATRWQYTQRIRAFFRWALLHHWIDYSPAEALYYPRPPKDPTKTRAIPTDLLNHILEYAYRKCERDYVILVLLCRTGMRRGACAHIQIDHISKPKHRIAIWDKGGFTWSKPLLPEVEQIVWHYIDHVRPKTNCPHNFLFTSLRREAGLYQPLTPQGLSTRIFNLCMKVGAEKGFRPHAIRHWVAEILDEDGEDREGIQAMLNQKSATSTENYISSKPVHAEQAAQRLSTLHRLPSTVEIKAGDLLPKIIRFEELA